MPEMSEKYVVRPAGRFPWLVIDRLGDLSEHLADGDTFIIRRATEDELKDAQDFRGW